MASELDICNLALSHLGDSANVSSINPPEGSAQAEHCARFYPIARDALLEMHDWGFATRRAILATVASPPDTAWTYAYAMPNKVASAIAVLAEDAKDDDGQPFEIETDDSGNKIIYTEVENARLRYVALITDTSKFTPLFVTAASRLLASYLAGPLIKGETGMQVAQAQYQAFLVELGRATGSDANQRRFKQNYTPDALKARGATVNADWLADGRIIR